jgi:peptide/nickel transport system substrate-binding protein
MKKPWLWGILVLISVCLISLCACSSTQSTTITSTTTATSTATSTSTATTTAISTSTSTATSSVTKTSTVTATGAISGGTLRIADPMSPVSIGWPGSPMFLNGGPMQSVFFDPILKADPQGNVSENLATAWEVASDKKSLTLTLRKGVKFHDGSDWNATVAKWNIETVKANNIGGWEHVTSIDVLDDYKIRLNMDAYSNTIFLILAQTNPISKAAYDQYGDKWLLTHAVGTGPFKFDSYTPDVMVKGVRFDGYWGGKPYLDAVEIHVISDSTTREAAFEKGEVDVDNADLSKAEYDLQQKGFEVVKNMIAIYCLFADSKNADSPFSKQKVRQAVYYAIDREALTKSLGYGWWTPSYQFCFPSLDAYIDNLQGTSFNLDKAKQLMQEAGYASGFTCKFLVDAFVSDKDAVAAMQGFLSKINIKTEVQMMDMGTSATYSTKGWNNGLYGVARVVQGNLNNILQNFSSSSPWWVSMDKTAEYDKLYQDSVTAKEYDPALAQKVVQYIYDNTTFIPVYTMNRGAVVHPNVHDTGFYAQQNFWFWNPAKAWLSK